MNKAMSRFQFQAVAEFRITESEASAILSDENPNRAINEWLGRAHPNMRDVAEVSYGLSHAAEQLKKAFGEHLADKVVSERKMLVAPIPVTESEAVNF